MSWHIMTYSQFDVVVVPFPFTDKNANKSRPALVLSDRAVFNESTGHSVMAMITTASHFTWPLDIRITDLGTAGLKVPSIIRMKLFTIDNELVREKIGELSQRDQESVQTALSKLIRLPLEAG